MVGKRTHVVIPETLIERRQLLEALTQASGTWKDKNHPELKEGAASWVSMQRRGDEKRDEYRRGKLSR